jgi:hypothetical protein
MHRHQVGDLYMSLIHTCELNSVNPFDYLTELQRGLHIGRTSVRRILQSQRVES